MNDMFDIGELVRLSEPGMKYDGQLCLVIGKSDEPRDATSYPKWKMRRGTKYAPRDIHIMTPDAVNYHVFYPKAMERIRHRDVSVEALLTAHPVFLNRLANGGRYVNRGDLVRVLNNVRKWPEYMCYAVVHSYDSYERSRLVYSMFATEKVSRNNFVRLESQKIEDLPIDVLLGCDPRFIEMIESIRTAVKYQSQNRNNRRKKTA